MPKRRLLRIRRGAAFVLLLVATAALGGCFKLERESVRPSGLPSQLIGEWRGDWQSQAGGGSGGVLLSVQSFQGQPVLQVETQHPCLTQTSYEFVRQGTLWQLRDRGVTIFEAQLDLVERSLVGSYQCTEDSGAWSATWDRELPEIPDLSGQWTGSFQSTSAAGPLELDLQQVWQDGQLLFQGVLSFPALQVSVPITSGEAYWRPDRFELLLVSQVGIQPAIVLQALGDRQALAIADGILAADDPRLPFRLALWSAAWRGE